MKATFCFYGPNGLGGPATWVRRMLPRLRQRGIDAVAVAFHTEEGDCSVVTDLRAANVPVRVVVAAGRTPGEGTHLLLAALAEEKPSVLVADHVLPAFLAGGWWRQRGVPTVMVLRSDDVWYRHLQEMFLAGAEERRVAAVVAVSAELERAARAGAPGGVEIVRCPSGTPLAVDAARWRAGEFRAVYLGRLDEEQKRVRELVRELIVTSRQLPGFSAALYGDGPLRGEVERVLQTEKGHRISYGGRLAPSEVAVRLRDAQALVLLSAYEGLSSAVQEAMACGLPVIARRTASGTEDVLVHGETAWVLEDDAGLPEAVARLMESEPLWCRLAAGGRALAAREFDIERAANRWAALLERLGRNSVNPVDPVPAAGAGEALYLAYLSDKPELEAYEAALLVDRGRPIGRGLERFFASRDRGWDERRCVLHRAVGNGTLPAAAAASYAGLLAQEAESVPCDSEEKRYRVASLWELAGESDRAHRLFAGIADTAERGLRVGSRFHLAQLALAAGRPAEAVEHARACLAIEPAHRAATALLRSMETPF